jgi:hypothetical protein
LLSCVASSTTEVAVARRLIRAFLVAAVVLLAVGLSARPLARNTWVQYAVWEACPLTEADQALLRPDPRGYFAAGELHVEARDPWDQLYRFDQRGLGTVIYSTGPNLADDGGPGSGDDVGVVHTEGHSMVAEAPLRCVALALLAGWLALLVWLTRLPRSPRVELEALRAALLAVLPALLGTAAVFRDPKQLEALRPLAQGLLLPLPAAVSAGLAFVLFLAALWFRLRRPAEEDSEPEAADADSPPTPRRWGRVALIGLIGVALCGAAAGWGFARYRAWQRDRLVAKAQLGLPSAIRDVLASGDDSLVRAFVRNAPQSYDFGTLGDKGLRPIAALGPDAMAAMLTTLDGNEARVGMRSLGLEYFREHDPGLEFLSKRIADDPAKYGELLVGLAGELVRHWGRKHTINRILPLLSDTRKILNFSLNGYPPRVCDRAANQILSMTGDDAPLQAPGGIGAAPTVAEWDAALARLKAWWANGPALTPLCWLRLTIVELPAGEDRPLDLEIRFDLGPSRGYFSTTEKVVEPTHLVTQTLKDRQLTLRLRVGGREKLAVPLDLPAKDSTLELRVDWTTGERSLRVAAHPE